MNKIWPLYKFGELTNLANKYETDKYSSHFYTEVYEYFFYPMKYKARKICEIGIWKGASLKMFKDYFQKATIYGIDINDASGLDSNRIKTFVADQANKAQLKSFFDTYGGDFDIIIDDAGHTMEQQQISFGYLFKYVKQGGYYIIEEVHTSLYSHLGAEYGAEKNEGNTTLTMINNFIRTGIIESKYMTMEEKEYLTTKTIRYCNLLGTDRGNSITCIFKKR